MASHIDRIQTLLVEELGVDRHQVLPTARLLDDLHADSLDRIELIMRCEEEFDIRIDDPEAEACCTVADIVALVDRKVEARAAR
jgi:acyl carrier protein